MGFRHQRMRNTAIVLVDVWDWLANDSQCSKTGNVSIRSVVHRNTDPVAGQS